MFQGSQIHAGFQGLWQRKRNEMDAEEEIMLLSVPFSETGRQILHYLYSDAKKTQESCHCRDFANLTSKGNTQKWEKLLYSNNKEQNICVKIIFSQSVKAFFIITGHLQDSVCVCVIYCMDCF